jgi:uncharacterized protein (TIGR02231 family)
MTTSLWLVAALTCAQVGQSTEPASANSVHDVARLPESAPPPRPAVSKITDVTVYEGQALVTRAVTVPEGDGTVELVVTPLPSQTVDSSLYTEGADGLRVLSTRFRTRAIKDDTRQEVRAKQDLLKKLEADAQRLRKEIVVQDEDLKYLHQLGGFTSTALTGLTEKGRLDSEAILTLSKFVMENRGVKSKAETDLRQQLQANSEAAEFATRQLAELSAGTSRVEHDAVIIVHKARPQAGMVRLGYLVRSATWRPQYRLRGGVADAPVRLEYLAAVVQQTGEPWIGVRVTLCNARPSLDAAPPELLPLKMAVDGASEFGQFDAHDDRSQRILEKLNEPVAMPFNEDTPLEEDQASGEARLNQDADTEQAEELHIAERQGSAPSPVEKDTPSVTFPIAGQLDIPSRRDPQLLEVGRVDLAADYYAKAVPVLTPRVYRLARLTNKSDFVLLPGEATVYVGSDFVGRMRLPLVAAGEPFIAGFGADPQLQVSRRLVRKSRSIQGGNQIFDYEFRLGLRNYRPGPVKVQLWDRLPKPQGEAIAVNLVKTSSALSTDPPYERTARTDNLLRWDLEVPQGTVGDKTMCLNYEFRLEYARDLPQPRFVSGGLREGPIGGGAMGTGGMGGGMGGMRSQRPVE